MASVFCCYSARVWVSCMMLVSTCLVKLSRCMLAAAACQYKNSSQTLSIQLEMQPEEIHRLSPSALVCHEAPTCPTCHQPCAQTVSHSVGHREEIQIGKEKSATPQVIKPAARHLSKPSLLRTQLGHTPSQMHTPHVHLSTGMELQSCRLGSTLTQRNTHPHTECVYK